MIRMFLIIITVFSILWLPINLIYPQSNLALFLSLTSCIFVWPFWKWLSPLISLWLTDEINRKKSKMERQSSFISKMTDWLGASEAPCTGPLHFLDKKIYSVAFNSLEPYLTSKEREKIIKLHSLAKINSDRTLTDPSYDSLKCQAESVPMAREFQKIVSNALIRLQKKWRLI